MKIRITKKPVKKYQGGGEPQQADFPDYNSYKAAYDAWVASGATSAMQNFQQAPNIVSAASPSLAPVMAPMVPVVSKAIPNRGSFLQLSGPQAPNYAWSSFGQAPSVPTPRVTTVAPDGTKTTTGNVGTPTVQYQTNNFGTPTRPFPIVNPNQKRPQKNPTISLVDAVGPIARYFDAQAKIKDARIKEQEGRFNTLNAAPKFRGNFTIDAGLFRPDERGVNEGMFSNGFGAPIAEYGGDLLQDSTINYPMKRRITGAPRMAYGGQTNYGLDLGQKNVYTNMQDTLSENTSNSMSEDSSEDANFVLEAEGGETILRPDGTHFNITGERHYNNGVKLTDEQAPTAVHYTHLTLPTNLRVEYYVRVGVITTKKKHSTEYKRSTIDSYY